MLANVEFLLPLCHCCPDGEMVDALVSGASVERRVGSTPIPGTEKGCRLRQPFFVSASSPSALQGVCGACSQLAADRSAIALF